MSLINLRNTVSNFEKLFDVVEFLFFLALVVCAQQMLSHAIGMSSFSATRQ